MIAFRYGCCFSQPVRPLEAVRRVFVKTEVADLQLSNRRFYCPAGRTKVLMNYNHLNKGLLLYGLTFLLNFNQK